MDLNIKEKLVIPWILRSQQGFSHSMLHNVSVALLLLKSILTSDVIDPTTCKWDQVITAASKACLKVQRKNGAW